ncbi:MULTISPECIES: 5-dehydro-4-deoxyglucarate dehydratase [unclassified Streptomyces]|uniref:5-dehydro-4-deoxyglucarate dehydratase n=1 Tax=unclassified Streptomyces TaxID=2593676 RepID=UPI000CD57104|nr:MULTISPECIES: 5-dehydro-4-deoxyglucarate dehydratase [unclassified Streptomyces]
MKLSGVLFFPVTPFDDGGAVDTGALARHVEDGLGHGPGGVFAACGTGELSALGEGEQATVVAETVRTVAGRVPVVAGAGGPLGTALAHTRAAAESGADGILLLPPYLSAGSRDGYAEYVGRIAEVGLPVVLYQRGPLVLQEDQAVELARIPGVVGLKDGLGDIERMQRIVLGIRAALGEDFTFFNGLPTAELTQPAYRGIGVELYSSAAFCFVPEVAAAFCRALESDQALTSKLLAEFYLPLVRLRERVPGYAVALVKEGLELRGHRVGLVRAPLSPVTAEHRAELSRIIDTGLAIVREAS